MEPTFNASDVVKTRRPYAPQNDNGIQASVLLLEGAGVPKITIRAYNRNIDWPQMVSNLLAVSADGEVRIGD